MPFPYKYSGQNKKPFNRNIFIVEKLGFLNGKSHFRKKLNILHEKMHPVENTESF